jgi:hypothetical protein
MNNKDIPQIWETIRKLRSEGKLSYPTKKSNVKINRLHMVDDLEIIKYTGINCKEIESWSNEIIPSPVLEPTDNNPTGRYLQFRCSVIKVGDWILKNGNGDISIFNLTGIDLNFKERKTLMDMYCDENNLLPIGLKIPFNAQSIKDYFKVCDRYDIPSKMYILIHNNKVIRLYD